MKLWKLFTLLKDATEWQKVESKKNLTSASCSFKLMNVLFDNDKRIFLDIYFHLTLEVDCNIPQGIADFFLSLLSFFI